MISRGKGADLKPRISPHRRDIHQRLDVSQKTVEGGYEIHQLLKVVVFPLYIFRRGPSPPGM